MGHTLAQDASFLLYGLAFGAFLGLLYDLFRIWRRLFPASAWRAGVQDGLFWVLAALSGCVFCFAFYDGVLRLSACLAAFGGAVLWRFTVGWAFFRLFGPLLGRIGCKIRALLRRSGRALSAPARFCGRKIGEKGAKMQKKFKEKQEKHFSFRKSRAIIKASQYSYLLQNGKDGRKNECKKPEKASDSGRCADRLRGADRFHRERHFPESRAGKRDPGV